MNTNDGTSQPASQNKDISTQPFSGNGVPAFNYAIALQQYQFQQSLLSQQLLAQHNAAAHAVSIKAAAEQAVARAAEISKLLTSSKDDEAKDKVDEPSPKMEKSESKSQSRSQSHSQSSKSKSASPIRYRNRRAEYRQYSPRGHRSYRSRRTSPYYRRGFYDRGEFARSNYRRDVGHSDGRHYNRRSRSRSRSRRRSPCRYRSMRYHHGQSHSPIRRHRFRSPSPKSDHRIPVTVRDLNRHSMSKSPFNSSSISSSPHQCARVTSPKKLTARRSLDISEDSQRRSSSENSDASELDVKWRKKEATPSKDHIRRSDRSNSISRSGNTSNDYSSTKSLEPSLNQVVTGKLASTDRGHSSSSRSLDEGSVPHRASDACDDESYPVLSENMDYPIQMLGRHSSGSDENFDDSHDGKGVIKSEDKKLRASKVDRRPNQDQPPSLNSRSLSREDSLSDHADKKKYSDERKGNADDNKAAVRGIRPFKLNVSRSLKSNDRPENELSLKAISRKEEEPSYFLDSETDNRMGLKIDHWNSSEDVIIVENSINDCSYPPKQGTSKNKVGILEYHNTTSMDGKMTLQKSPDELKPVEKYDSGAPVMLPDEFASVDTEQVSGSPATVCQYPQERYKHRSKSRERRRKHSKRHHKRRKGEVSDEDEDHIKDSENERKTERNRRKDRKRHDKSRKERKRKKRKYRDTSSSSSEDSLSSDDKYRKQCYENRSKGSRKKGGTVLLQ